MRKTSQRMGWQACSVVSTAICKEIASLLAVGVSTEQSKQTSKEFSLTFEEEGFSLMPPKLDGWMSRRAKEKNVFKMVSAREEEFIRTQLKVMDIGSPLIDLYTRLCEKTADSPVEIQFRHSLQAALKQWGRAFARISKKQREAVIGSTDPRVDYLLKEDIGLTSNKEAREFLERMLKEAHQDNILAKRDQAAASLTCGKRNPFQSTRRGSSMDAPLRQDQHVDRQQAERGRPRSRRNIKVGARMKSFANQWERITDDQWILDIVYNGLKINFLSQPFQRAFPPKVTMSEEMRKICQAEISSLIEKRAVTEIIDGTTGFVCSFFCIPKKSGGYRPIVNLKPLNKFINFEHLKMENLETVRFLVRKGDWFIKLDLKDAYLSTEEGAKTDLKTTLDILHQLGFFINWEKSVIIPTQVIEYLGMIVNSTRLSFSLPTNKVHEGNFTWAIPTIPFAQSHYRSMQRSYITESKRSGGNLNEGCTILEDAKVDLEWWVKNLEKVNGKDFYPKIPDIEIYSDASLSGWGAIWGGTKSIQLTSVAKALTEFCEQRKLSIEAVHLAGVLNVEADRESKADDDASDWMLDRPVFRTLNGIWRTKIDLFSSHWNAQLPSFVSWRPQPKAKAVNAFSINWRGSLASTALVRGATGAYVRRPVSPPEISETTLVGEK
ncbi:Uncharacterized protein APZ42_014682 [Daphnia magna]|uniref:Reverse transcriptase domain-containing protein n=1 Tax=Daphnia magna TaxID=35525 RepID=A0A162PNY9_9CRUS|nr:Uncharacterized protein APZ42_014682 [Daphnia magna]